MRFPIHRSIWRARSFGRVFRSAPGALAALGALTLVALGVGCSSDSGTEPPDPMPDFHLVDENPNSATHDSVVSPRDYLGRVSAWYFGHAT